VKQYRILITGSNGFLGENLQECLTDEDFLLFATSRNPVKSKDYVCSYSFLDVCSLANCQEILDLHKPNVIINTAALTNVDYCEKKKENCQNVNVKSIFHFMNYVQKNNTHFIQISTDFVFDGVHGNYSENAPCSPLNFYGRSKLESEKIIINNFPKYTILRTSLLYGQHHHKANFLTRIKQSFSNNQSLFIVGDQFRTPTFINDLSIVIMNVIKHRKTGLYHISSGEMFSIFDIVCSFAERYGFNKRLIKKICSSSLDQIALRPMNTSLDISKSVKELNYVPTKLNNALNQIL